MRYYEHYLPNAKEPFCRSSIRHLKDLPIGTRIYRTITDRDGSLIEQEEIPVVNGKPQVSGRGKQRPQIWYG